MSESFTIVTKNVRMVRMDRCAWHTSTATGLKSQLGKPICSRTLISIYADPIVLSVRIFIQIRNDP